DDDTNSAIIEVFQTGPGSSVFPLRDDFAERDYDLAETMFDHNLSVIVDGRERCAARLSAGAHNSSECVSVTTTTTPSPCSYNFSSRSASRVS
ncbi:MAG: hypothetical protein AAFO89_02985, partial [Planctomycetota bacterium]